MYQPGWQPFLRHGDMRSAVEAQRAALYQCRALSIVFHSFLLRHATPWWFLSSFPLNRTLYLNIVDISTAVSVRLEMCGGPRMHDAQVRSCRHASSGVRGGRMEGLGLSGRVGWIFCLFCAWYTGDGPTSGCRCVFV